RGVGAVHDAGADQHRDGPREEPDPVQPERGVGRLVGLGVPVLPRGGLPVELPLVHAPEDEQDDRDADEQHDQAGHVMSPSGPGRCRWDAGKRSFVPLRPGSRSPGPGESRPQRAGRTRPRTSPKPMRAPDVPGAVAEMVTSSPSSRNVRGSPLTVTGSFPPHVSSMKAPRWSLSGPETVPDANRSPVRADAPFTVMCASICAG